MSHENVYQFNTANFSMLFPRILKSKRMLSFLEILPPDKLCYYNLFKGCNSTIYQELKRTEKN